MGLMAKVESHTTLKKVCRKRISSRQKKKPCSGGSEFYYAHSGCRKRRLLSRAMGLDGVPFGG